MAQGRSSLPPRIPESSTPGRRACAPGEAAERNANHHLWRNGRLWWVAFTVHLPGWQKERVRISLGTEDLAEARRRRDQVLKHYPVARGCELSLRMAPPRSPRRPERPQDEGRPFAA